MNTAKRQIGHFLETRPGLPIIALPAHRVVVVPQAVPVGTATL